MPKKPAEKVARRSAACWKKMVFFSGKKNLHIIWQTSKFAADDCDNAWEQFTQNTSGKNGVLLGYGTIKGQTVTIIANKYDRGSSNYVGHMLTQDHIYVNNHYNSENHEKILV